MPTLHITRLSESFRKQPGSGLSAGLSPGGFTGDRLVDSLLFCANNPSEAEQQRKFIIVKIETNLDGWFSAIWKVVVQTAFSKSGRLSLLPQGESEGFIFLPDIITVAAVISAGGNGK